MKVKSKTWESSKAFWGVEKSLSTFLVLLLLSVFILPPLMPVMPLGGLVRDLIFTVLLISGVVVSSKQRLVALILSAIVLAAIVVHWVSFFKPAAVPEVWLAAGSLASTGIFLFVILGQVFRSGPVTRHRIEGAIAAYLLLGLTWASAYGLVASILPDAFAGAVPSGSNTGSRWIYFSFVTLTTMGYGDITPVHSISRSLAILEALTGQLYPAILLARLVSLELLSHEKE